MSEKLDVLLLLHLPPPYHGSSVVGESIVKSPRINRLFNCRFLNLLTSKSVDLDGYANPSKILRFVVIWFRLLFELINKRPKLAYLALSVSGSAFYKDIFFVLLLRVFGVKRVYHMHNKGVASRRSCLVNRILYPFVFRSADVILLSSLLYGDVSKFVPKSRVHICPNGIDGFASLSSPKTNIESKVKILFLSNLIESKGVNVLLNACRILKEKQKLFECVFVGGEGDLSASQFQVGISDLMLSDCVTYVGRKFGLEKNAYFNESDIFAFPTYYKGECFPLVLLEAMRAGLPIVSTFEGGIPDIIDEGVTGFVIPQKDVDQLANKLELLIDNPVLRKKMGLAGCKKFKENYTLVHFEDRLVEIMLSVA